jgi:hypothetical protein
VNPPHTVEPTYLFEVTLITNIRVINQENVMGELISFKRPDGQDAKGYRVEPAQGSSAPGIVVI